MIPLPTHVEMTEHKGNRAVFRIEGLYPGYGSTIGNALRRILFSSIQGAAITSVKIKGVTHEFSTLPGVLEDILEITLNLKGVRLILHGDEPQAISLKAKGKNEVTAGDIETPSQVEIVNPDSPIATLADKSATLEMEMTVERGLGYETVDRRKKEKGEIGVIHLDAIFTPVKKANFSVEDMRVGDRTDYNRLLVELETDGTVSPDEAFRQAIQALIDHFYFILQYIVAPKEAKKTKSKNKKSD